VSEFIQTCIPESPNFLIDGCLQLARALKFALLRPATVGGRGGAPVSAEGFLPDAPSEDFRTLAIEATAHEQEGRLLRDYETRFGETPPARPLVVH
jgi:hypothetical protein